MPNNNPDNQDTSKTPPVDEDTNAEAGNAPDNDAESSRNPQPQVTTKPTIKNY